MGKDLLVTSTDPSVDVSQPKVTGTTVGAKHGVDTAVIASVLPDGA